MAKDEDRPTDGDPVDPLVRGAASSVEGSRLEWPVYIPAEEADLVAKLLPLHARTWHEMRRHIHNWDQDDTEVHGGEYLDRVPDKEDPLHSGDAAKPIDKAMHGFLDRELPKALSGTRWERSRIHGEEQRPSIAALADPAWTSTIMVDPVDGTRQAGTIPGCYSSNLVAQEHVGRRDDGLLVSQLRYLGMVDAEGFVVQVSIPDGAVEVRLLGAGEGHVFSDPVYVQDRDLRVRPSRDADIPVLIGAYKQEPEPPKNPAMWTWHQFKYAREVLRSHPVFNTGGAPVTHKVLRRAAVGVELSPSTLWDGVMAAFVAAAGGCVVRLGETEPLTRREVLGWFDNFGYEYTEKSETDLGDAHPIPAFVAGMTFDHVVEVAEKIKGVVNVLPKA
jgi:hypothetical protein